MSPPRIGELLRHIVVTTVRESVPPEAPEILRFFAGLGWRLDRRARPERANLIAEEAQRCFGVSPMTALGMAREAHDVSFQSRLEELVIPRSDLALLDRYVRVSGALPTQAVVMLSHAGNAVLAIATLARMRPGLVVLQRPPTDGARSGIGRRMAQRFAEEQARLPVLWESDASAVPAHLAAGRTVVVFWDDRSWTPRSPATVLGRPAALHDVGWVNHVPIVATFIHRLPDKTWTLTVSEPVPADRAVFLAEVVDPWLRAYGTQWLPFVADCALGVEPAPFFDAELTPAESAR